MMWSNLKRDMQLPYRECHIGILKGDYFKLLEANKITSEIKGLGL